MKLKQIKRHLTFGVLIGTSSVTCQKALAAGSAIRSQSASGMGTALASDGVNSQDATGIFANPAVMSELKGQNLSLSLTYSMANIKAKDASLTNTYPAPTGVQPHPRQGKTSDSNIADPAVMPSLFGVHQISDTVHVGWSVTTPWAASTDFDKDWAGRYHAIKTLLVTTELAVMGGYKINDMFNIGLGVNLQKGEGELTSAVDLGLIGYSAGAQGITQAAIGNMDAISKFKGDSLSYGMQFGLLAKPTEALRIGFGFRSEIRHHAEGDMTFVAANAAAEPVLSALSAVSPGLRDSNKAKLVLTQPAVYSLGASYKLQDFTLYGNATYTGWSSYKNVKIKYNDTYDETILNWKDSLYVALGGEYRLDQAFALRAGLGYDQRVNDDHTRTPRTPDNNRIVAALGGGYKITDQIKLNAAYEKLFIKRTTIDLSDQVNESAHTRGNLHAKLDIDPSTFVISTDFSF